MSVGVTIVNAALMTEARKRRLAQIEKEKEKKKRTENEEKLNDVGIAVFEYNKWKVDKPLDKNGKIKLSQKGAKAIVKALMPRVDPTKKVKDYTAMYKCVDWLMSLEDWEREMEAMSASLVEDEMANHKRLF